MFIKTILAAAAAAATLAFGAQAATVGNAATNRANGDTYSNFGMAFTSETFTAGIVTGWETYIEFINGNATSGTMGMLVLGHVSGDQYQVKGSDIQTVSVGANSFISSVNVANGDILGVYMANAKVSFDYTSGPVQWTENGALASAPSVGDYITFDGGPQNRVYSINATVSEVPVPAAGFLLFGAIAGFGLIRRRG